MSYEIRTPNNGFLTMNDNFDFYLNVDKKTINKLLLSEIENIEKYEGKKKNIMSHIKSFFKIGDKAFRKNHNYPDEPNEWVEFVVNETYLKLIKEFPNDYWMAQRH